MARRAVAHRRGPKRATDWSASVPQAAYTGVAAATAQLLETFSPIVGGETLVRTRGLFAIRTDQPTADENQIGAIGMAIVTAQAVSVGITVIFHPATDAAWGGWFWHAYYAHRIEVVIGAGFAFDGVFQTIIDSKAMRKIDEDERLVVVIENLADGIEVLTNERFLTKVH